MSPRLHFTAREPSDVRVRGRGTTLRSLLLFRPKHMAAPQLTRLLDRNDPFEAPDARLNCRLADVRKKKDEEGGLPLLANLSRRARCQGGRARRRVLDSCAAA